ncbi:S8 family serine peptidase [Bacteroidales bacterium OttesenSCG-928-B11]|nr:S8 family serine peptidase [Bacteroidales bacterium OttesenSCG-928-E04]MDL2308442.1 S8 family serine peptidase [Bacteroidales bacterium OttesenSCG-928-C03]MDL2311307.1 S8 family serine peptidase [Bacteroidales bacterium OttesenSCG-928-B11]MDL2326033.1 S8 family serine peptidase [Bacteroidales bacterium OttesenSCG-928-A14]
MRKKSFLFFLLSICFITSFAQYPAKYFVQFTDKANSDYSISRPEEFLSARAIENRQKFDIAITEVDLPVNKSYIDLVLSLDTTIALFTKSKWFNAITVYSTKDSLSQLLKSLDFVANVEVTSVMKAAEEKIFTPYIYRNNQVTMIPLMTQLDELNYGKGYSQVRVNNIHWLHRMGFKGEGVPVMVMDGGFLNVDQVPHFAKLRDEGRLVDMRNFVNPGKSAFRSGSHGTMVLSCIAAEIPGELIGTAPKALVYLANTEDGRTETKVEEDNWVAGIEWADSLGCLVLNSSLGYTKFDDTLAQPRNINDLNGQTSRASIAATMASDRGMIVCNSAGNEGAKKWRKIGCPADAVNILAVGAVDSAKVRAPFSSQGPTADGRVKPDAVAVGRRTYVANPRGHTSRADGTSFSSPMLAGMVTCLRQAFPDKTNLEIMDAIRRSGHLTATPTDRLGYGITDFLKAYNLLLQSHTVETEAGLKLLEFSFPQYHTIGNKLTIYITAADKQSVAISTESRRTGKIKTKKYELKAGLNIVKLSLPKLKGSDYDIYDLRITGNGFSSRYVIGQED